jgi:hypothetical protein
MLKSFIEVKVKKIRLLISSSKDVWAIGFILGITLLFFYRIVLLGKTFWGGDVEFFFYPTRVALANALREGHWRSILWSPYIFGGYPLFAEGQTGTLYPLNLLLGLPYLSPLATYNALIVLHYFLGSAFTYTYARVIGIERIGALVSSIVFAFSGFLVSHLAHMSLMNAAIWLPLIFLFTELWLIKKNWRFLLLVGLVLGIQFLAGHPQVMLMTFLALGGYTFVRFLSPINEQRGKLDRTAIFKERGRRFSQKWRRIVKRLIWIVLALFLIGAIGVSIAAAQMLPLSELVSHSIRPGGALDRETAASYSLPAHNLLTFVFPFYFYDSSGSYWGEWNFAELALYVGIIPLVFAMVSLFLSPSKYVPPFFLMSIFGLLLALGDATPLFKILHWIPVYKGLRCPARFVLIVDFSLAMLAGFGTTRLSNLFRSNKQRRIIMILIALWALAVAVFTFCSAGYDLKKLMRKVLWGNPISARKLETELDLISNHHVFLPIIARTGRIPGQGGAIANILNITQGDFYRISPYVFLLASILVLALGYAKRARAWAPAFCLLLTVVDLFMFSERVNYTLLNFQDVQGEIYGQVTEFLKSSRDSEYVYNIRYHPSNTWLPLKIHSLDGYSPLQLKRHQDYEIALRSYNFDISLLSLASVGHIVDYTGWFRETAEQENLPIVYKTGAVRVYENASALPRSFVVHSAISESEPDPLELLQPGAFDPSQTVILEEAFDTSRLSGSGEATVDITNYTAMKVTIHASLTSPGFLVLNDTYYPGWRALVNDEERKIYRANYLFRAVFLPAGDHTIEFVYRPLSLYCGLVISLLTLSVVVGILTKKVLSPSVEGQRGKVRPS